MNGGFYLVTRPKCLVRHYGVLAEIPGRPPEVFELLPEGYRVTDLEGFAAGRKVKLGEWRPLSEERAIRARLRSLTPSRWHLCWNNCEHVARWVLTGRRESRQIVSWSRVAAAVVGVAVLLARR